MTKEEHIQYWLREAADDWVSSQSNFNTARFNWSLFIGHLVLEKAFKALWVKTHEPNAPPYIHNLIRLAEESAYSPTDEEKLFLDEVNKFNIVARYPDYEREFSQAMHKRIC